MIKLIGTDGSRFYNFALENKQYTIGRNQDADLVVAHKTVSRNHATIEYSESDNSFKLTDNGSRNGTFKNGVRLTIPVLFDDTDLIQFGQVEFKATTNETKLKSAAVPITHNLSQVDAEKSVFLSINEALKPLPSKVTELPDVLPTMFEMAKILALPEPKDSMLDKSIACVSKVIPSERIAILTRTDLGDVITSAVLLPSGKAPGSFNLSKTIISEILTEKNSILINPQDDDRFAKQESIIISEIKSAMAVPLFDDEKVLGILYVDTTNPLHRYNNDYLRLLATFGNLIASRLLNYELIHERQEMKVMEAELSKAASIQKNLLLQKCPDYKGYSLHSFQEQCKMVGGDLFDIAELPDGRLLFLVADVSGKGMGASLLMSNILAAFRILYTDSKFDLIDAVKKVSIQLVRYSKPELFATLFIGIIDNKNHTLSFVNAGHNPPILLKKSGEVKYLEPSGVMIGAFDFADWTEDTVEMNDGDMLLVFTDGVVEADKYGELYGDDRLEVLVKKMTEFSPEKVIDVVMKDVLDYVMDSPRSDDITMLALKRN